MFIIWKGYVIIITPNLPLRVLSGGTGLNGSIGGGAVEPFGVRWSFHVCLVVVIFPKNAAGSGYFL